MRSERLYGGAFAVIKGVLTAVLISVVFAVFFAVVLRVAPVPDIPVESSPVGEPQGGTRRLPWRSWLCSRVRPSSRCR